MRGLQVLACLAFFGTCAGIGSSSKGDLGLAQWQVHVTTNGVTSVTTPATCEAYLVSGSKHQSDNHGTYVAKGECEGKTLYECVDCSSSLPEYLYYYAPFANWIIGNIGCGSKYALLYTKTASDDPSSGQWSEQLGSEWVETPTISLERSCAAEGARGLNFAAIVGEPASELFTQNIALMLCVVLMLCGAVVAFLHFLRKQPRKKLARTPVVSFTDEDEAPTPAQSPEQDSTRLRCSTRAAKLSERRRPSRRLPVAVPPGDRTP